MNAHILIGAASSGSGKTTLTLGLLRLLSKRGYAVQPFKCGPDYIDTQHHALAAGCPSVNLDTWMASEEHVRELYSRYGAKADVCLTEGVMGLFDGYDGMKGSSAAIASLLQIPVVLVLNARSMAYSVAPILYGYKHFNPTVRIAGVIFNQVAGESHFSYLKQACTDAGVHCFGYLPRQKDIEIPSRHLGLTLDEKFRFEEFSDRIAASIEKYIQVDDLLNICSKETENVQPISAPVSSFSSRKLKIAVAHDEAFNFTYQENINQLKECGDVELFSPIRHFSVPLSADLLYLPGGYPEFFSSPLSANKSMIQSIRDYALSGGRVLAECGGMMYLCNSITGMDGISYPMAGVLDQEATMENMKLHLGYRMGEYNGVTWRGHEFHYSSLRNPMESACQLYSARNTTVDTALIRYKNVIAGYTHLYWGEQCIFDLWK